MTSSTPTKPIPSPALLVYGKPTSPDHPQASWFRAEDRPTVVAAAQTLKFSVLDILTDAERALTLGVHEGVLKGAGRMIVGSVTPEVYKRIEEYVAKASGSNTSPGTVVTEASAARVSSEQNINTGSAGAAAGAPAKTGLISPPPNPWDNLRVGARVLAAYWGETREFEGFWLATVKRIENGEFTLEWFEAPEFPPFKSPPKNIAIPHPEFRPSGK